MLHRETVHAPTVRDAIAIVREYAKEIGSKRVRRVAWVAELAELQVYWAD